MQTNSHYARQHNVFSKCNTRQELWDVQFFLGAQCMISFSSDRMCLWVLALETRLWNLEAQRTAKECSLEGALVHCSLLERCDAETYGRWRRAEGIDITSTNAMGCTLSVSQVSELVCNHDDTWRQQFYQEQTINLISKYNVIVRDSLFDMTCTKFVGPWQSLENVLQDGQMCCGLLDCNDIMTCGMSTSTECIGTVWTNTTQSKGVYLDTVTWNTLILILWNAGKMQEAVELFQ
jgi:hypothetical protein